MSCFVGEISSLSLACRHTPYYIISVISCDFYYFLLFRCHSSILYCILLFFLFFVTSVISVISPYFCYVCYVSFLLLLLLFLVTSVTFLYFCYIRYFSLLLTFLLFSATHLPSHSILYHFCNFPFLSDAF